VAWIVVRPAHVGWDTIVLMIRLAWIALGLALTPAPQHVRGSPDALLPPPLGDAPGLQIELRTRNDRTTFHLYESIPVEILVSSSTPRRYSIELDWGWNAVAGDIDWVVSPADTAIRHFWGLSGYACCSSHRAVLTNTPEVFRYYLTDSVRFRSAGTYQIQYHTREIFRGGLSRTDESRKRGDVPALSNVVTLEILPDDPDWDAATLKAALAVLDDGTAPRVLTQDRRRQESAFGPHIVGT
jgi:hypothetical protein